MPPPALSEPEAAGATPLSAAPAPLKQAAPMPHCPTPPSEGDGAAADAVITVPSPSASPAPDAPYLRYLARVRAAWPDLPQVRIQYHHLSVTFATPVGQESKPDDVHSAAGKGHYTIPTLANQAAFWAKLPVALAARKMGLAAEPRRYALQQVSGVIEPGSMTLVLAPPGHGKSSYLKALCGRLPASALHGSLLYNGRTPAELASDGVELKRLTAYVGQMDLHFPALTVRETVTFASQSSVADVKLLQQSSSTQQPGAKIDQELVDMDRKRADMLIELIGLGECADTYCGNDMLRGVSGGQRKVSTGLDAAVTTSIFSNLRSICALNGSSVVATLLQPTPDTYAMFDQIILLHDGQVAFHGPRADVKRWLWEVCGLDVPASVDEASFLMDFLVNPAMAYETAQIAAETHAFAQATRADREASETGGGAGALAGFADRMSSELRVKSLLKMDSNASAIGAPGAPAAAGGEEDEQPRPEFFADACTPATRPDVYEFATYSQVNAAEIAQRYPSNAANGNANGNGTHPAKAAAAADDKDKDQREPSAVRLHLEESPSFEESQQQLVPLGSARNNNGADSSARGGARKKGLGSKPLHSTAPVAPVQDMADLHRRYRLSRWFLRHAHAHDKDSHLSAAPGGEYTTKFVPTTLDPKQWSPYTRASFGQPTPHPPMRHMALCWSRQFKLFIRAVTIMIPRMAKAFLIGLCYGLLFFQLSDTQFAEKLAVVMYAGIFAAMTNLSELPVASEARNVIAKQLDAGFYRASPYTVAACAMHIPVTLVESLCYSTLFYWLAGLEADGGRFLFHLLLCVMASNCMAVMYRFISYATPNPDIARQLDLPFVVLFIIMNAYLVVYSEIPIWLANSAYWISPLSWTTRSLAINEYSADKYDIPAPGHPDQRVGDFYLDQFDLQHGMVWKWMGVIYLLGWMLIWMGICTAMLNRVGLVGPQGSEREHYSEVKAGELGEADKRKKRKLLLGAANGNGHAAMNGNGVHHAVDIEMGRPAVVSASPDSGLSPSPSPLSPVAIEADELPDVLLAIDGAQEDVQEELAKKLPSAKKSGGLALSALPFTPVTLAWHNLHYSVTLPNGTERVLLKNISGFGVPGQMTALMGASGAGKTTLMDCCAGRKTTGCMTGEVMLNGVPADIRSAAFQQLCGYVEQNDLHIGSATVEEALQFSAFLRLPTSVSIETQHTFVREVMVLLGLDPFAGHLIGDAAIPGLGPAQLKLVTIGLELVSNPSILFLDEPTSGLDAPAAWRVMTAIKRIALTGRTCIATIHQPSARLFYLFDRLLLLQPGGETIYNHAIGGRGEQLISYLEAASGFKLQLPEDTNPADFALGLRTDPNARGTQEGDWAYKWTHSRLNQTQVVPLIEKYTNVATFKGEAAALSSKDGVEFASWTQRYWAVQKRLFVSYWRNSPMNLTRTVIAIVIGFLIGLTYYGVQPNSFAGVNSFLAGTFMAVLFGPSLSSIAALPTMFRQRPVFYRECTVRMYDVAVYQLTLTVAELFSLAALMVLYTVPHYWLMGLNASGYQFFRFLLIVFLMAQVYASLSQAYLAFLPNQVAAAVVHAILFAFFFVFGGLLITAKAYPIGFKWFYYMLPTPKAYIALALGQLSCSDSPALAGGFGCGTITTPNTSDQPVQVYEYVSTQLENSAESYGNQVGWMILIIVVIKIATAMGFKWISHLKR